MSKITFPTWIDLGDGRAIVYENGNLLRVDQRPDAFCPVEARFPDNANRLLFVLLLSPDLMGLWGDTSQARRAEWAFELPHSKAIRAIDRLMPLAVPQHLPKYGDWRDRYFQVRAMTPDQRRTLANQMASHDESPVSVTAALNRAQYPHLQGDLP